MLLSATRLANGVNSSTQRERDGPITLLNECAQCLHKVPVAKMQQVGCS
jgi:hypothetical protein